MSIRHLLHLVLALAACRAPAPAATPGATTGRAVNATVRLVIGPLVQEYDLRADHAPAGFITLLHPVAGGLPVPLAQALGHRLADLPFVRDSGPLPANPVLFETPAGVVSATLVYRPLGAWQVLDHVEAALVDRTVPAFQLSLRNPRLEP